MNDTTDGQPDSGTPNETVGELAARLALTHLARQRILHDDTVFDSFASPPSLHPTFDPSLEGDLGRVLHRIVDHITEPIRGLVHVGSVISFTDDSGVAGRVDSLVDRHDSVWVRFVAELGFEVQGSAEHPNALRQMNTLNHGTRCYKFAASQSAGIVARTTAMAPLDSAGDDFAELAASLLVELHAGITEQGMLQGRSGARTEMQFQFDSRSILTEIEGRWETSDVTSACRAYKTLAVGRGVDDLVILTPKDDGVTVNFPMRGDPAPWVGKVMVEVVDLHRSHGVRITAPLPVSMSERDALRWARTLNSEAPNDDIIGSPPWLTGCWLASPGDDGFRLFYVAFVPSEYRRFAPLVQHVEGAVAEVIAAWEFRQLMGDLDR